MYHVIDLKQPRGIKNVTLPEGGKKIRGCRGLLGRVIARNSKPINLKEKKCFYLQQLLRA